MSHKNSETAVWRRRDSQIKHCMSLTNSPQGHLPSFQMILTNTHGPSSKCARTWTQFLNVSGLCGPFSPCIAWLLMYNIVCRSIKSKVFERHPDSRVLVFENDEDDWPLLNLG
jgi:hypothetical protein